MADSHNTTIAGILLAVVVVGVAGLYFSINAPTSTIIYTSSQGGPSQLSLADISQPFTIKGYGQAGVTGLASMRSGTAQINLTSTLDLRMTKNAILCTAQIFQDNDTATLYTCGDRSNVNGTLICDDGGFGGTGNSISNPTTNVTCSTTQNNGAFVICNYGANATLTATVTNITIGGGNSTTGIHLDNIIYNASDTGVACNGLCNNCPFPDTTNCNKDTDPATGSIPQQITECEHFRTSGVCLCECFSIHITDPDTAHLLKNGDTLEFQIKKTVSQPATSEPSCT